MRGRPMLDNARLQDMDVFNAAAWLGDILGMSVRGTRLIESMMMAVCAETQKVEHAARLYRRATSWDGIERLTMWAVDYCGAKECAYTQLVSRLFLVAMIARALEPGRAQRFVFVLCGPQNKKGRCRCPFWGRPAMWRWSVSLDCKEAHMQISRVCGWKNSAN